MSVCLDLGAILSRLYAVKKKKKCPDHIPPDTIQAIIGNVRNTLSFQSLPKIPIETSSHIEERNPFATHDIPQTIATAAATLAPRQNHAHR